MNPTGMFDVIIGNPPFQEIKEELLNSPLRSNSRKLYIKFMQKFLKKTAILSFVIPSNTKAKVYKVCSNKIIQWKDIDKDSMHIALAVCYFVYDANAAPTKIKVPFDIDTSINIGSLWDRPLDFYRDGPAVGKGTIPAIGIVGPLDEALKITTVDGVNTSRWKNFNKWKVVVNKSGPQEGTGPLKIADRGIVTAGNVVSFGVATEQEAKNLKAYMESKLIKYLLKKIKKGINNSKEIYTQVPLVDLSRSWSDKEIYDYFGLTPEQIKEVDAVGSGE